MPAIAGLSACFFANGSGEGIRKRGFALAAVLLAIGINAAYAFQFPRGIVGYESVGRCLASLDKPGNVLLCCWEDQDLIFRYRSSAPRFQRAMLRGDRLLAIRLPEYARVKTTTLIKDERELLDVIRRGRARYVVTSCTADESHNDKFQEILLAHRVAASTSGRFRLIERFPLLLQYGGPGWHADVYVWEYLGELPPGPSELDIRIPTADMTLRSVL